MPNKLFGVAEPIYDALRVQSNQAIWPDAGGSTSGIGGLLENKIYLWPADGSTITTYDPDEAGLIAALAAAVSGDTVWLPSILIALTVGVVVGPGVALVGISDNASLSFSGFDGAAITLGGGSALFGFSLSFAVTGAEGIGIDNTASDTWIEHVHVQVSGATVTNIGIGHGEQTGREVWSMFNIPSANSVIVWSDTFDFSDAVDDTVWNVINSWPVGYSNGLAAFRIDGSEFYIGVNGKVWRCTNQAAIRANPATAPAWTKILDESDVIDGVYNPAAVFAMGMWNDVLYIELRCGGPGGRIFYGEYASGAWTWYDQGIDTTNLINITYRVMGYPIGASFETMHVYNPTDLSVYFNKNNGAGQGNVTAMWRNQDQINFYLTTGQFWSSTTRVLDKTGAELYNTGETAVNVTSVGGAYQGRAVFFQLVNSHLYVSEDGTTFTAAATSGTPFSMRDNLAAGGGSIAGIASVAASGTTHLMSRDRGLTFGSKTGDFWAKVSPAAVTAIVMEIIF